MIRPANEGIEVWLCVEPVDFRKQITRLATLVQDALAMDPFSTQLFVFTNRRRTQCRILYGVESRTGAPTLGSGGGSVAFASGLSPAPIVTFPVPAHRTGQAVLPHPALGRDHAFAHGKLAVRGAR